MKCPTCGFEQPETRLDCEYCGLVFSKWKAKQEAAQKAEESRKTALETPPLAGPSAVSPSSTPTSPDASANTFPMRGYEKGTSPTPATVKKSSPTGPFPNPHRLFELLGSLYFQQGEDGGWLYYPWGKVGSGFVIEESSLLHRFRTMETVFALCQSFFLPTLGLSAITGYFRGGMEVEIWVGALVMYLAAAYGFFGYRVHQLILDLPIARTRFNDKKYLSGFIACFNPVSILSPEAMTLLSTFFGILALSSAKLPLLVGDAADLLSWLWIGASLIGFGLCSYLFYFQKNETE